MSCTGSPEDIEKLLSLAKVPVAWKTPRKVLYCQNQRGRLVRVSEDMSSVKVHTVSVVARKRKTKKRAKKIRVLDCLDLNSKLLAQVADLMSQSNVFVIKRLSERKKHVQEKMLRR